MNVRGKVLDFPSYVLSPKNLYVPKIKEIRVFLLQSYDFLFFFHTTLLKMKNKKKSQIDSLFLLLQGIGKFSLKIEKVQDKGHKIQNFYKKSWVTED